MARKGVNKVVLLGNLGNDPETKYAASGAAITNVSVATSESWTDKQTGQKQERTEWHRVVFFGKLAEIAGEYLRKGSKVYIEGSLRTNKWQDQNGADRYSTDIVASEMQMLDTRSDNQNGGGQYAQAPQQQPRQQQQRPAQANQYAQATGASNQRTPPPPPQGMVDFDDDIPF